MAIPFLNNIDLVKNQLLNAVFQNLATAPTSPKEGQFYYNTTDKKMFYYNGTAWVDTTYLLPIASATVLGGVKVGSGLAIAADGTLSATGTDTEIINNLTSDRTDAALAAAQGKVLKGLIDTLQTAINGLGTAATKNVGTASGNIPVLDSNGKLNTSVLPALAITEVFTVASQSAMTSLTAQQGDVAVRTDVNKTFILSQSPASTLANWIELQFPISVTSVNGKTGIITLTGEDINATVGSVTKSVQSFLADLGEIDLKVQENTTTITTIETQVNNITNTKGEAEGKNIHLTDSAEEPLVDISLHGESTQKTRSGKNILNLLKCSFSHCTLNSDNKSLTCNLNNQYYASIYPSGLNNWLLENKGKTITFSTGTPLNKNTSIVIYGTRSNGSTHQEANEFGTGKCSITIANDFTAITSIELRFNRQGTIFTDTTTVINYAMLELGSTATDYEEYGVMPSPDYPSEIENVEGKNLFDQHTLFTNAKLVLNDKGYYEGKPGRLHTLYGDGTDGIPIKKFKEFTSYCISFTAYKTIDTSDKASFVVIAYYSGGGAGYLEVKATTPTKYVLKTNANRTVEKITLTYGYNLDFAIKDFQIEEGTVATPYVPYNSLEFKVEGKNIFDCANSRIIYNNGNASYERLDNGLKPISSGAQYNMIYFLVDTVKNLKDKTLTLSSDISFSKDNQLTSFGLYYTDTNGGNRKAIVDNSNITSEGKYQVTGQVEEGENRYYVCIALRPNMASNFASGDYTIYDNLQVEFGEPTPYEPYKSQVAYFPLAEGQKLMEGSYLADDGIHHKRKQYTFTGNETFVISIENNNYIRFYSPIFADALNNGDYITIDKFICTHFEQVSDYNSSKNCIALNQKRFYITISKAIVTDVTTFKTLLSEQYANGTPVIVEYDLAEPETLPYTAEQQEAWDKIRALMTYKNVTNISSDACAKIVYMRDNGLDVYETKQSAKVTKQQVAQQKITTDEISSKVSSLETTLENNYSTTEEMNSAITAKVNETLLDVDSLPEITDANRNRIIRYNGKLYSVSNKYTGTAKDLSVGADLSSAKLILSFPDTLYANGYSGAGNLTFITTEGSAVSSYNGSSNNYMCCISIGTHGLYGSQIYSANTNTNEVYTNMKSYIMPSNAGKITELKDLSAVQNTGFYVNLTPYIKFIPATEAWICIDNEIAVGESEPVGQEKLWIDEGIEIEDIDITQKVTEEIEKQTKLEVIPNTEVATNEYINGKRVYIKQLEFTDTFDSASPLTKAHGITGATKVWIDTGNSYIIQNNVCYPLPLNCFMGNFNDQIGLSVNLTELYIHSQTGWNDAWTKVVRLKYIK